MKPITIPGALGAVAATTAVCGAGGLLIGGIAGAFFPSYYRVVFQRAAEDPNFDAVEFGLGLGLTQGVMTGVIVGTIVVAIIAWSRSRPARAAPRHD